MRVLFKIYLTVNVIKFCQVNKTLPYLVSNVIELLDVDPEELGVEEDGGHVDLDSQRKGEYMDLKKNAICSLYETYV